MKKYLLWKKTEQSDLGFVLPCPLLGASPPPAIQFPQSILGCGTSLTATTSPTASGATVGLPSLPDRLFAAFASQSQLLVPQPTQREASPITVYTGCGAAAAAVAAAVADSAVSANSVTANQLLAAAASSQHPHPREQTNPAVVAAAMCAQLNAPAGTANNVMTASSALSDALAQQHARPPTSHNPFLSPQSSSAASFVHPSAFSVVNAVASSSNAQPSCASLQHSTNLPQQLQHSPNIQARTLLSQVVQPAHPQPLAQPLSSVDVSAHQTVRQAAPNQQMSPAAAAAALYPQLMCLPVLLDRFSSNILRSHMTPAQLKPIPRNERVDLARFRAKEPQEWTSEDVVAWMLDVATRNKIPFEDLEMKEFASYTGPLLLLMTEQNFKDRDPNYGSLLYTEFRKLFTDESFIDEWMRVYKEADDEPQPSTSRVFDHARLPSTGYNFASNSSASLSPSAVLVSQQQQHPTNNCKQPKPSPVPSISASKFLASTSSSSDFDSPACSEETLLRGVNLKIKKNKDGKPRKRSQHTKGNKLWEFIRDALKDPTTCPSVVRWEDPVEGVFRIVESEKLARLWGEKKNNQKMTYEKLSRAMRTYYEKQILVPVPKTGLYPKKLVYKFGPSAQGWDAPLVAKMEHCA